VSSFTSSEGPAGAGAGSGRRAALTALTTRKIAKATITNWMSALTNSPKPIVTAGMALPAASTPAALSVSTQSAKSTPPSASPIGGISTRSTSTVTILPNAAPITTPTARSTTLPRIAKVRNSLSMPMVPPGDG
jgi:hypothetical protein